jgi:hypothetical protein
MATSTAPARPGGKKILGLKPKTAIIAGVVVFATALGYLWWRSRQAKASSASTGTSASTSAGTYAGGFENWLNGSSASTGTGAGGGGSSASTGTSTGTIAVPNVVGRKDLDTAEGIIKSAGLVADAAGDPGTGNKGSVTSQTPTAGTKVAAGSTVTITYTVPGSSGGGGTGTTTKTTPKPAMPSGVHATKKTANSVTLSWNKDANATSYRVRVTYQDKLVGSPQTVSGTSATISGLSANRTYTMHVAAIGPGGTSAETNGPAVKTS